MVNTILYIVNVFEKISFVFMITCSTCYGQLIDIDLEDSICGIPKKQMLEVMSYSSKIPPKGIALNSMCLEDRSSISNDQCLTEQYKLIECLQKERFLVKESEPVDEVEENHLSVDPKYHNQELKRKSLRNIVVANEELDNIAKDYEETIMEHLQSIDDLMIKRISVDDHIKALTNTKVELAATIQQKIINSINKINKLGVYCAGCFNPMNSTHKSMKLNYYN